MTLLYCEGRYGPLPEPIPYPGSMSEFEAEMRDRRTRAGTAGMAALECRWQLADGRHVYFDANYTSVRAAVEA